MARVIYKTLIPYVGQKVLIKVSENYFRFLHVGEQNQRPCVWYETVSEDNMCKDYYEIIVVGTGHPIPDEFQTYLGTSQMNDLGLVWHLYGRWI
ncbi:MAG: hypothetical protein COA84_13045 [Robiginitomaculum sp.]|nr:MAG: hypothetical protein COA84_13045 [Robiginitomaculum sp.]